ncbi:MAG TPA: IMP dehydrogenase [Candidatus Saccharimonadales bacterium]|nr:IMP dehydrogenase [Candidatus Saccharimonadales bacterium]
MAVANRQKTRFFKTLHDQGVAVTYDDVRLRTIVTPTKRTVARDVDLTSRFSRNIELKIPFVSSPMDTVTGSDMAIAMAMAGGLGIIHAAYDVDEQRAEARRVKLYRNGLIDKPVTVTLTDTVRDVLAMRAAKKYEFSTFPVVDAKGRLAGMFTQTDIDYCRNVSQRVAKHMTPLSEVVHAKAGTPLRRAYTIMRNNGKLNTLPLVNKDGTVAGLYIKSDVKRVLEDNPEDYNLDANGRLLVGAALPTDPEEAEARLKAIGKFIDVIVIDTANGNSRYLYETLKRIKQISKLDVVAGNVSEGHSARLLAEAGVDGIRVGQGGGSICTTRQETGIGTPQVTAVYECSRAVESFGIPVCADGGIKDRGDIPIALAAGAESVMMGNMLAALKESPGKVIVLENGQMVKEYRGMGSPSALRNSAASRKRYGAGVSGTPLPEGVETQLPYKGSLFDIMPTYVKALRKSMEYVGAPDVKTLRQSAQLWRITNAGLRESRPHDV